MKLQYYTKNVYGNTLNYPVECMESKSLLNLLNSKTITKEQMNLLEDLDITFERVFEPVH